VFSLKVILLVCMYLLLDAKSEDLVHMRQVGSMQSRLRYDIKFVMGQRALTYSCIFLPFSDLIRV